jgi:hypothetical protein
LEHQGFGQAHHSFQSQKCLRYWSLMEAATLHWNWLLGLCPLKSVIPKTNLMLNSVTRLRLSMSLTAIEPARTMRSRTRVR